MRLWTYQNEAFDITVNEVNPLLSKFAQRYREEYKKLWVLLGTKTFVWCCASNADRKHWPGDVEWELEVTIAEFLGIIDVMVWNGILGNESAISGSLRSHLRGTASDLFDDLEQVDKYVDSEAERMRHPENPWEALLIEDSNDLKANILLKCPIQTNWFVDKNTV